MDDLISRQAAIDAVMDEFKKIPTNAIRAKTRLEELPPAKPEISMLTVTVAPSPEDIERAVRKIHDAPVTVLPSDEPEIIRCSQCKYAEVADKGDAQDGYTCQFHRGSIWFSGSFCSWAERRTDETQSNK